MMIMIKDKCEGKLWRRLSGDERQEIIIANLESKDHENLIAHSVIGKKHKKWL